MVRYRTSSATVRIAISVKRSAMEVLERSKADWVYASARTPRTQMTFATQSAG